MRKFSLSQVNVDKRHVLACLVLACTLGGCIVVPDRPYYGGEVVSVAPPAPRVEVYGAPPTPGYIWLGGYWGWTGGRHEWVGGHWEAPRRGYRWVPHRWVHQRGGWRMAEGHWARR